MEYMTFSDVQEAKMNKKMNNICRAIKNC